ncbi:MAG: sigma-54 dependent transcriptional regulator [Candidatus Cloacimonadales bacterium]
MKIILIDDDAMISVSLQNFLKMHYQHQVEALNSVDQFLDNPRYHSADLIISDIKMPGSDGWDLLEAINNSELNFQGELILITGNWSYEVFSAGVTQGAFTVLEKPISLKLLNSTLLKIEQLFKWKQLSQKAEKNLGQSSAASSEKPESSEQEFCFHSAQMQQLFQISCNLHKNRALPVLISGETGVGKEVIARIIHQGKNGSERPFVSINCSAIPENLFETELFGYEPGAFTGSKVEGQAGKFELANGGTIFLDEIGDLPLALQPKILRVLQEKEFYRVGGNKKIKLDVRMIFASHKNLSVEVKNRKFREDLFYRISTIYLSVPALRERPEDIKALVSFFLAEISRQNNLPIKLLTKEAQKKLQDYDWPGNVRELKNVVERAILITSENVIDAEKIVLKNSPVNAALQAAKQRDKNIIILDIEAENFCWPEVERIVVQKTLDYLGNNKAQAARKLKISVNRLKRKL